MTPRRFRPSKPRRVMLILQWPSCFGMLLLVTGGLLFVQQSGGWAWIGIVFLAASFWGAWRAWNVAVTVTPSSLVVTNPMRTYRLEPNPELRFSLGVMGSTFPSAIGVQISSHGKSVNVVASGLLSEAERRRLSSALARFVGATAGTSELPATWASGW
jgi:hypothetical protein